MNFSSLLAAACIALGLASAGPAIGAEPDTPTAMNNQRLDQVIRGLGGEVSGRPGFWVIEYSGYETLVITDENADRMRIMAQVGSAEELDRDQLYRLMQANFDSALDARYAVAKGAVWSTFLHPLAALSEQEFLAGFAQTLTLASTYGTTFSSGGLSFSGGDKGNK